MVELWCPVAAPTHVLFGHVMPIVVLATILLGLAIGFGLDGELQAIQASSQVHF